MGLLLLVLLLLSLRTAEGAQGVVVWLRVGDRGGRVLSLNLCKAMSQRQLVRMCMCGE